MNDRRFFFVHVMKTAGGTIREHVNRNFDPGARYPDWRVDPPDAYFDIARLRDLPRQRHRDISVYVGHFPYVVSELVGDGLVTLTVLRDPVERTISLLKQRSREREVGMDLETIYAELKEKFDGLRFRRLVGNHQTKIFAMTQRDPLKNYMDVIDLDDDRVAIAKHNLRKVDVIGVQDNLPAFYRELSNRYEWRFGAVEDQHVSPRAPISHSFREHIAADVRIDIEFYDYAKTLIAERTVSR